MNARPAILLALAITLLAGCESVERIINSVGEAFASGAEAVTTKRDRDTPVHLGVEGPVAIDVESFGGDVTVETSDDVRGAVVTITRRALHGPGRSDEAATALQQIEVTHEIVPGELGPSLRVRATTNGVEPHFLRADVHVRVAAVDGLRVRTRNGEVIATGISGAVDVTTSDGDVRVLTPQPMVRPVTIINHSGDIDYRVRGESTGDFDALTVRGRVIHHVKYGRLIVRNGTAHDRLLATFNNGENPILLRAADGDIRIAVVAAPLQIGQHIVE
ncbi:MAG: DUF4097 family beta strand repeat protein [Planctomycetes bacterium]|nr:DUF4097 family beta strand repeat protein [Planctomycetota bacterium]